MLNFIAEIKIILTYISDVLYAKPMVKGNRHAQVTSHIMATKSSPVGADEGHAYYDIINTTSCGHLTNSVRKYNKNKKFLRSSTICPYENMSISIK